MASSTGRLGKIERLLSLQTKIHRLAEWQLADLDRQRTELTASEQRLFDTLNSDAPLHGLFVEAMARRLAQLARDGDRLQRARETQQRRLQDEGLRLKRFERSSERLRRQDLADERKKHFATLLEALAGSDDASPASLAGQRPPDFHQGKRSHVSISPPSDIILDVARAADPGQAAGRCSAPRRDGSGRRRVRGCPRQRRRGGRRQSG